MATKIHPTAVVEPGAQLGADVSIGPFCLVEASAVIGDRTQLVSHVSILGATSLGSDCQVFPMSVLGAAPQNTKHKGGHSTLEIGNNCTMREGVTMHRGTDTSRARTVVGDNGNFLAFVHIAHDCVVGRNVTMANQATLGGHCEIGDFVGFGGLSAIHQFCRVGHHAFIGGGARVFGNVIPYGMVVGERGKLRGLNIIGMKRSGLSRETIHGLRKAYRTIFDHAQPLSENLVRAEADFAGNAVVADVIGFIRAQESRHLAVPALRAGAEDDDDE